MPKSNRKTRVCARCRKSLRTASGHTVRLARSSNYYSQKIENEVYFDFRFINTIKTSLLQGNNKICGECAYHIRKKDGEIFKVVPQHERKLNVSRGHNSSGFGHSGRGRKKWAWRHDEERLMLKARDEQKWKEHHKRTFWDKISKLSPDDMIEFNKLLEEERQENALSFRAWIRNE